jgi:hypothetical protein
MAVNFAAVHDQKPWRKHSIHQTVQGAVDGNDGAKNLLRQTGRVAIMWQKYGDVRGVFVWEDDAELGQVFRIDPKRSGSIQSKTIPVSQILRFHKNRSCSAQEIAECFADDSLSKVDDLGIEPTQHFVPESPMAGGFYPDELPEGGGYIEGAAQQIVVNRFERSLEARNACIAHYGCTCQVCNVDFGARYGELGIGFIHVHHRVPIWSIGAGYRVDPVHDLVPVCPNCHAMLHRYEPPLEIEQLREVVHDRYRMELDRASGAQP